MTVFDWYLLRTFVRVLLISFASLVGLFIIIDLFGNLEEFITYAERQGSLLMVLVVYYGARVLSFFDRTSALLALLAAIFTITWTQRCNELTAVMAAGISKARAVRVLILGTVAVALLAAANREILLPTVQDRLTHNAQDLTGQHARRMTPRLDHQTRVLIGGKETVAAEKLIVQPIFRLPQTLSPFGRQLVAATAIYREATGEHPGGYLLTGTTQPKNLAELASAPAEHPIVLTPRDQPWLNADQCFVASDIPFERVAAARTWKQYASTRELIQTLRNPSFEYGADTRVLVHRRLVQPILDVTLLFLGLPLVLSRSHRNMFVAAGQCLLLVGIFFVVSIVCQTMGNSVIISPALAAWLPLLIFAPLGYLAALRRWE